MNMDELEELHRELDVADAAPPVLHITLALTARHLDFRPNLQGTDVAEIVGAEGLAPQDEPGPLRPGLPELDVLKLASAVGASCVRAVGTTAGVFTRAEADAFIARHDLVAEPF